MSRRKTVLRRIHFEYSASLGSILASEVFKSSFRWHPPVFPPMCVCCGGPNAGRTQPRMATGDKGRYSWLEVPVCAGCEPHAFQTNSLQALAVVGAFVGVAAALLAWFDPGELPDIAKPWVVMVWGLVLALACAVFVVAEARRTAVPEDGKEHHTDFEVELKMMEAVLITTNQPLADELLRLNAWAGGGKAPPGSASAA